MWAARSIPSDTTRAWRTKTMGKRSITMDQTSSHTQLRSLSAFADRCERPTSCPDRRDMSSLQHSMELPLDDVGMESRSGPGSRVLRRHEAVRTHAPHRPIHVQPHRQSRLPTRCGQLRAWSGKDDRRCYFAPYGHRQGGIYGFGAHGPQDPRGRRTVQSEEGDAGARRQVPGGDLRFGRPRGRRKLGGAWHLVQLWAGLHGRKQGKCDCHAVTLLSSSNRSSQVYVQDGAYDRFISILKEKAAATKIGFVSCSEVLTVFAHGAKPQPADDATSFGPLVRHCKCARLPF